MTRKEIPGRSVENFWAETLQARTDWHEIVKIVKIKKKSQEYLKYQY